MEPSTTSSHIARPDRLVDPLGVSEAGGIPAARVYLGPGETELAEARVLKALAGSGRPLTLLQLYGRTGVPLMELKWITASLCGARSIRRLNTIIESFSLPAGDDRPAAAGCA